MLSAAHASHRGLVDGDQLEGGDLVFIISGLRGFEANFELSRPSLRTGKSGEAFFLEALQSQSMVLAG